MKALASTVASSIGNGLVAGFVGTAAMTVSSSVEARIRHRAASSAPARACPTRSFKSWSRSESPPKRSACCR